MEALYYLFKNTNEHIFPFELLEHFDLVSMQELEDAETGRLFHEIVFNERGGDPTAYVQRRFEDFPMNGLPVQIIFQRNLAFDSKRGLSYCKRYPHLANNLRVRDVIKQFLTEDYGVADATTSHDQLLQGIA